jgi:hypothetical protein
VAMNPTNTVFGTMISSSLLPTLHIFYLSLWWSAFFLPHRRLPFS